MDENIEHSKEIADTTEATEAAMQQAQNVLGAIEKNEITTEAFIEAQKKQVPIIIKGLDGAKETVDTTSSVRAEVEALEEEQRRRAQQYEQDRMFFEQEILKQERHVEDLNEDYIKLLHPHYRKKFLLGLEKYGTPEAAAQWMHEAFGLDVKPSRLKYLRQCIPAFNYEIEDAIALYQGKIQRTIHQRAVEGVKRDIYHQGEVVGQETIYSEGLLSKIADTMLPVYKDAKNKDKEVGHAININIIKDFRQYNQYNNGNGNDK